jgi:hypothetical protein
MKQKPNVGSPFFRAFPSDHISKATKAVGVHFFIHTFITFLKQQFLSIIPQTSRKLMKLLHMTGDQKLPRIVKKLFKIFVQV